MSDWIQHDGGKRPVPADTLVDVMWTTGEVYKRERADFWLWCIPLDIPAFDDGPSGVIGSYRISEPKEGAA